MGIPRITKHLVKGMQQDISKSKFSNEYAYEVRNARLLATDSQTTFAVTNERGNKEYIVTDGKNPVAIKGTILGHCEVNDYIVLFTHDTNTTPKDHIYRIDTKTNIMTTILEGDMSFDIDHKIETIGWFESESIIKVYWIDGKNQPRYVNIADGAVNDISVIDFVPEIGYGTIEVSETSGGMFTAGMIQYGYNLYRKYGAQSKLSGLSPLMAITARGEGAEKDTQIPVAYNIKISDVPDKGFNNVRLYRIHRTELNSLPKISLIYDGELTKDSEGIFTYKDNGQVSLEDVSLEQLSFLGSDFLIPQCIAQHSNRLIFANYKEQINNLKDLKEKYGFIGGTSLPFSNGAYNKDLTAASAEYIYYSLGAEEPTGDEYIDSFTKLADDQQDFSLDFSSTHVRPNLEWKGSIQTSSSYNPYREDKNKKDKKNKGEIKTSFKRGETYRFGIQFCDKYGTWLEVIHLADIQIPRLLSSLIKNPRGEGLTNLTVTPFNTYAEGLTYKIYPNYARITFSIPASLCKILVQDFGITKARIVRVQRDNSNSTILSQGILTSTLFQRTQRDVGFWAMPDYLTRPLAQYKPEKGIAMDQDQMQKAAIFSPFGVFEPLAGNWTKGAGPLILYENSELNANDSTFENPVSIIAETSNLNYSPYGDSSILNFWSPEVTFPNQPILDLNTCSVQLIGWSSNEWTVNTTSTLDTTDNKNINVSASIPGYENRTLTYLRPGAKSNGEGMIFTYDSPTNNHKLSIFRSYYGINLYSSNYELLQETYDKKYAGSNNGTIDLLMPNINKSIKYNSDIDLHYTNRDASKTLTYKGKTSQHIVFPLVNNATVWQGVQPYLQFNLANDQSIGDRFTAYNGIVYDLITGAGFNRELKDIPIAELHRELGYWKEDSGGNKVFVSTQYGDKDNNNNLYIVCSKEEDIVYSDTRQSIIDIIADQGDIYLQRFTFLKSYITDSQATNGVAEALSVLLESTIDLDRRYDNANNLTDVRMTQPDEFYKFNEVYNQTNNLFTYTQIPADQDVQTNFPNKIIASSSKVEGSKIDNGTNILQNEFMDLDGQYGEIRKLQEFNSFMYGFQDRAVSYLIINPRVQIEPSDGVAIELGTGQFLSDKRYITTKSGTKNKWGVCSSNTGIYYIDDTNSSINKISGEGMQDISTIYGLHAYMSNLNLNQDFNSYFHNNNDEIYFNFKETESLIFSEAANAFTEFMDITPNVFISYKDTFLTDHIVNNVEHLYTQFEGDYNNFYGELKDSSVTIISNENVDLDKTYDNIEFRSECYSLKDGKWNTDVFNETYNYIHSWNERQDSGEVPLIYNNNLKERFRIWRTPIPRHNKSLIRMRNGWQFIKLGLKNENNRKVILHDINVKYSI